MWQRLRSHFKLIGSEGVAGLALNVIDMAAGAPLLAAGVSLARLLGSRAQLLPVYATVRSMEVADVLAETAELLEQGLRAVQVKRLRHTTKDALTVFEPCPRCELTRRHGLSLRAHSSTAHSA